MNIFFIVLGYTLTALIQYKILKSRYLQKEMFFTFSLILTGLFLSLFITIQKIVPNPHKLIEFLIEKLYSIF
ncbi:hypothetical protein [Caldicellulosiruptor sp. DIB 104C]|uniref:hypothetical protein n=1 Tax=Caldicellulosiruptor sp. DIB 104C TaxID=3019889 RepID=UPI002305E18F|nr:hypothetical protein [Caldicellulosiruptor sp. DIB 104C]